MRQAYYKRINVTVIYTIVFFSLSNSITIESSPIRNLVETFDEKYLRQFSVTIFGSIFTAKIAVSEEFLRSSGAIIALNALDSHLRNANVSNEDNHPTSFAENEKQSITFGLASNTKDFWTIFETTLKVQWNCNSSHCVTNNGRLVLIAMWPEPVNEDAVVDLIENSIRTNPLLIKFHHALGMDKNAFILFPIYKNPTDINANQSLHTYELYFIKDLLVIERVKSNVLEDMLAFKLRRSNFRKVPIISVTQPDERISVYAKHTNVSGKLVLTGGQALDYLDVLSLKLNFTPNNIIGTGWINRTADGSLTGMGEQLLNGEADVILSRSEVIQYRVEKLTVSHILHNNWIEAFFKKPVGIGASDIYFTTFAPELWLAILAMWIVIGVTFVLFVCCKRIFSNNETIVWSDIGLWLFGSASNQGWNSAPSETSLRIAFVSGKFAAFIGYSIFSSIIISRLSVERNFISSVKDLQRDGFELYSQDVSVSSVAIVKKLTGKSNGSSLSSLKVELSIKKINNSKAALITEDVMFFGLEQNISLCPFKSNVKLEGGRVWSALYFRKNDPIRKFFDFQFSMWHERGLLRRIKIEFRRTMLRTCDASRKLDVYFITLFDVSTAFLIFGVGALISIFSITTELGVYSRKFTGFKD